MASSTGSRSPPDLFSLLDELESPPSSNATNNADFLHPSPSTPDKSTPATRSHASTSSLPLAQPPLNALNSSPDKSSSTSSTPSSKSTTSTTSWARRTNNSSESSNESSTMWPSLSPADIYPASLRESYVEHLVYMQAHAESVGFWLVRQIIDTLKGVCTMGGLRRTLRRYYKEDFVRRIGKYYREIGAFETDAQMVKFMDWYFLVKGVSLREVALYIVERSFVDHEATRFGEAFKAGLEEPSRKEVGQSEKGIGQESGRGGRDEDYGNTDGGGGGSKMGIQDAVLSGGLRMHATWMKIVLDIDPIRVTVDHDHQHSVNPKKVVSVQDPPIRVTVDQDHSQHNVNRKKVALVQNSPRKRIKRKRQNESDKLQELLQTTLKYSRAITTQLPSEWQHNVDFDNKSQSTGLLYHATTKSNISTLKFGGIRPQRSLRSQLTTGEAFYVGNSLPECILHVLLKKPQLERIIPDPVAVLSFEMETRLLEHDAERKEWVVLDLNDHSLDELQDIMMHNMTGRRENLYIEEEDKDGELTGAVVPVDLVIGPWLMPIPLPGSDRIQPEIAYDGVEPFQFAFTSPKSWDYLQESYHAVSGSVDTAIVPFLADRNLSVFAIVFSAPGIRCELSIQFTRKFASNLLQRHQRFMSSSNIPLGSELLNFPQLLLLPSKTFTNYDEPRASLTLHPIQVGLGE